MLYFKYFNFSKQCAKGGASVARTESGRALLFCTFLKLSSNVFFIATAATWNPSDATWVTGDSDMGTWGRIAFTYITPIWLTWAWIDLDLTITIIWLYRCNCAGYHFDWRLLLTFFLLHQVRLSYLVGLRVLIRLRLIVVLNFVIANFLHACNRMWPLQRRF